MSRYYKLRNQKLEYVRGAGWVGGGCSQTCTRFPILVGVKWNVQFIYDYVLYDGHIMDVKKESSMNRKCMNWFCFCSVLHEEKHNHLKSDFF